jgi:hypothetical protein
MAHVLIHVVTVGTENGDAECGTPMGAGAAMMLAAALLKGAVAAGGSVTDLVNVSLYRVSPLEYPGVTNMDTGDPG